MILMTLNLEMKHDSYKYQTVAFNMNFSYLFIKFIMSHLETDSKQFLISYLIRTIRTLKAVYNTKLNYTYFVLMPKKQTSTK